MGNYTKASKDARKTYTICNHAMCPIPPECVALRYWRSRRWWWRKHRWAETLLTLFIIMSRNLVNICHYAASLSSVLVCNQEMTPPKETQNVRKFLMSFSTVRRAKHDILVFPNLFRRGLTPSCRESSGSRYHWNTSWYVSFLTVGIAFHCSGTVTEAKSLMAFGQLLSTSCTVSVGWCKIKFYTVARESTQN